MFYNSSDYVRRGRESRRSQHGHPSYFFGSDFDVVRGVFSLLNGSDSHESVGSAGFPVLSLKSSDGGVKFLVPVPGYGRDDVDVSVDGDVLTVKLSDVGDRFVDGDDSTVDDRESSDSISDDSNSVDDENVEGGNVDDENVTSFYAFVRRFGPLSLFGERSRSFKLGFVIDPELVSASVKDGLLTIVVSPSNSGGQKIKVN